MLKIMNLSFTQDSYKYTLYIPVYILFMSHDLSE